MFLGDNTNQPGYYELQIEIGHEALEAVADFLLRSGANGFYYDEGPLCTLRAYFRPAQIQAVQRQVKQFIDTLPKYDLHIDHYEINTRFVPDTDWSEAWKEHYDVQHVTDRLVIRPVWLSYHPQPGEIVIDMDPGMAFGTGEHPTTTMCLSALERVVRPEQRVADIGTGSGILSVAAAKLGAAVWATDIDPEAVNAAQRNIARNGVDTQVHVLHGSADVLERAAPFDVIVMNIIADVIIDLLPAVNALAHESTKLLLSGIINTRQYDVEQALQHHAWRLAQQNECGEWIFVLAER